jgi:RimJ/RimL family protein N-acetyltransferase
MPQVALRQVAASDLPIFFDQQTDPEANQMAAFPARAWPAFLEHWGRILHDDEIVKRTILADGEVAGYVVAYRESGRRQVGYWLGRTHWGRGIATGAVGQFLGQWAERPLFAIVAARNLASRRVLEKCGFSLSAANLRADDGVDPDGEELLFELPG